MTTQDTAYAAGIVTFIVALASALIALLAINSLNQQVGELEKQIDQIIQQTRK